MEDQDRRYAAIAALADLHGWLKGYATNQGYLENAIAQLRDPELTEEGRERLRQLLSRDGMFHIKWLGDCYVEGFPVDKGLNPYASWLNYLSEVLNICQEALK